MATQEASLQEELLEVGGCKGGRSRCRSKLEQAEVVIGRRKIGHVVVRRLWEVDAGPQGQQKYYSWWLL